MREFWDMTKFIFACIGGWLGYFLGDVDMLIYTLLVFCICDYLTGVLCGIINKRLSSEVGFKGICKKIIIFVLVGVAHMLDVNILGEKGVLRTAVIFFYLSNEGLSLLENSAYLGVPIPEKLKAVLEQLHNREEKGDIENER